MSGIFIASLLAFVALTLLLLLARRGVALALMPGAALMLGLAGYSWQGRPGLDGSPAAKPAGAPQFDEAMTARRRALSERLGPAGKWLVLSDGLARSGDTESAANVLVAAVRDRPDDPALWVGLGNALIAHGQGIMSPSADYAFGRALTLDPQGFAPLYFYGLALAQTGKLDDARKRWGELLARLPAESELHADLTEKIAVIDMLIARQAAAPGGGAVTAR